MKQIHLMNWTHFLVQHLLKQRFNFSVFNGCNRANSKKNPQRTARSQPCCYAVKQTKPPMLVNAYFLIVQLPHIHSQFSRIFQIALTWLSP